MVLDIAGMGTEYKSVLADLPAQLGFGAAQHLGTVLTCTRRAKV
jgi:hypothetical protein